MEPLSDREKRAIMFLHDNENVSWNTLSLAFNKPPETLLKAIQRFRAVADWPPKIIVKNNKIDPQIGRELKQMVKESP